MEKPMYSIEYYQLVARCPCDICQKYAKEILENIMKFEDKVIFKKYPALSPPEDLTHNPYDNPPEIIEQKSVN